MTQQQYLSSHYYIDNPVSVQFLVRTIETAFPINKYIFYPFITSTVLTVLQAGSSIAVITLLANTAEIVFCVHTISSAVAKSGTFLTTCILYNVFWN